ncbi:hypothetical protein Q428_07485 [Fervidicella metallireducens AeB]|uniref:HTH cro/C1-type domain-containing protein n=1 Tax=Fervidicella metallireducens AeB TaxID=1403537 RepID=A0A017RV89_9CLOT|nr:LexA family transcriptional regulator [Fervidicella metallireducens]EYE88511.1 hypothetical protein Q428_07485 [Fervidicella metallireducens AeB]
MSRVGKKIQETRIANGLTAKQFAKKLAVAESFINEVESGRRIANESFIKKVEKTFNINIDDDVFEEIDKPIENIKETENMQNKAVNKQWEDAFSHILKKIPVCDISMREIYGYKYLPVIDKKVEGYNSEKLLYVKVPDDSMRGFRIQKEDSVMVFQNPEIVNNSISIIEINEKRVIRQIKRLDANKVLLISHYNDIKTETKDVKEVNIIGRCVKLEIEL